MLVLLLAGGTRRRGGPGSGLPVDGGNDGVHGKGAGVEVVEVPDATADVVAIGRVLDRVVDGDEDGEEPGQDGKDLVGGDFADRVRLASAKRIDWACK